MNNKYILGIDIGGTNIRLAIIDENYNLFEKYKTEINNFKENFIQKISKIIANYLSKNYEIKAIVFGIPGIVHENKIFSCPNLLELEDNNLKNKLENHFNIPVYIEKDVNLIMLAEYNSLKEKSKNVLGFFIGTGFGFSMILNRELYEGTRGFAGELGHIPLKGMNKKCNCGNEGCLELYAAGKRIDEITQTNGDDIENFFIKYEGKDEVNELLNNISLGIVTAINLLDPSTIILGGGVVKMNGFPKEQLIKMIKSRVRSEKIAKDLEIIDAKHSQFGGCLGAGIYGFKTLLSIGKSENK